MKLGIWLHSSYSMQLIQLSETNSIINQRLYFDGRALSWSKTMEVEIKLVWFNSSEIIRLQQIGFRIKPNYLHCCTAKLNYKHKDPNYDLFFEEIYNPGSALFPKKTVHFYDILGGGTHALHGSTSPPAPRHPGPPSPISQPAFKF
jgi:hypothetical protein